jgi:hypothetical protein
MANNTKTVKHSPSDCIESTEAVPDYVRKIWFEPSKPQPGKIAERLKRPESIHVKKPLVGGHCPAWIKHEPNPILRPYQLPANIRALLATNQLPINFVPKLLVSESWALTYPWSAIGKVLVGFGDGSDTRWASQGGQMMWTGSGALVGENLMITAGHVVPWGRNGGDWWMKFIPAFNNVIPDFVNGTEPLGSSFVAGCRGFRGEINNVQGDDQAVCKLYTPLGKTNGYFGRYSPPDQSEYSRLKCVSVGYPGSFQGGNIAAVEFNANITDVDSGGNGGLELETAPFTSGGWSGGPLFCYVGSHPFPLIVGTCEGRENEFDLLAGFTNDHSVHVGGSLLLNLIDWAEKNFT